MLASSDPAKAGLDLSLFCTTPWVKLCSKGQLWIRREVCHGHYMFVHPAAEKPPVPKAPVKTEQPLVVNMDEQPELPAPAPATFQAGPPSAAPVEVPDKSVADLGSRHGSEKVGQQLACWPHWHSCYRGTGAQHLFLLACGLLHPPLQPCQACIPVRMVFRSYSVHRGKKPCTASAVSCRLPFLPLQKSAAGSA